MTKKKTISRLRSYRVYTNACLEARVPLRYDDGSSLLVEMEKFLVEYDIRHHSKLTYFPVYHANDATIFAEFFLQVPRGYEEQALLFKMTFL